MDIQKESYSYCSQYDSPKKCPYLLSNYCSKFDKKLVRKGVTDMWTCRDVYVVERCEKCKEMFN